MVKIVINACYGGFSLSDKAIRRYGEVKGITLYSEESEFKGLGLFWYTSPDCDADSYFSERSIPRDDPALIAVVEALGPEANSWCANLTMVELQPGTKYRIIEYDGYESIETEADIQWSIA